MSVSKSSGFRSLPVARAMPSRDQPRALEAPGERGVPGRRHPLQQPDGAGRGDPLVVAQDVLQQEGDPLELPAAAGRGLALRRLAPLLVHLVDDGVQRRVVLLDAGDRLLDQVGGCHLALADELGQPHAVERRVLLEDHGFPRSRVVGTRDCGSTHCGECTPPTHTRVSRRPGHSASRPLAAAGDVREARRYARRHTRRGAEDHLQSRSVAARPAPPRLRATPDPTTRPAARPCRHRRQRRSHPPA